MKPDFDQENPFVPMVALYQSKFYDIGNINHQQIHSSADIAKQAQ
jgi:hypothetical protein